MTHPGLVAQLVERRCSNPEVVGSNPAGVKDFSFILVLISNFLLLRPVVGGKLWKAVLLTSWHSYIHTLHHNLMHGSILPVTIPPPGNPRDKSSPSGPGVGNCLKRFCPGGRGVGQTENNFSFFL